MNTDNNNVPARDKIDYDATLFVCGYTVDEATTKDSIVVGCRICGAPMMRAMSDIKYHPDVQVKPCRDCQRAFAAFRRIMWRDRTRERMNAHGRKHYAAHSEEMRLYQRRQYYATRGVPVYCTDIYTMAGRTFPTPEDVYTLVEKTGALKFSVDKFTQWAEDQSGERFASLRGGEDVRIYQDGVYVDKVREWFKTVMSLCNRNHGVTMRHTNTVIHRLGANNATDTSSWGRK